MMRADAGGDIVPQNDEAGIIRLLKSRACGKKVVKPRPLSPLQFGMSLQVAQDVAAREDSLDSAI